MKKIVKVSILLSKNKYSKEHYAYSCLDNDDIKSGDYVVIFHEDWLHLGRVYGFAKLAEYNEEPISDWIIQKVDVKKFEEIQKQEARKAELKIRLENRKKELRELKEYEELSKDDEEINKYLKELKLLNEK